MKRKIYSNPALKLTELLSEAGFASSVVNNDLVPEEGTWD